MEALVHLYETVVGDLDPGYRVDTDKRIAVLGDMAVRALQQDRISKSVPQA